MRMIDATNTICMGFIDGALLACAMGPERRQEFSACPTVVRPAATSLNSPLVLTMSVYMKALTLKQYRLTKILPMMGALVHVVLVILKPNQVARNRLETRPHCPT